MPSKNVKHIITAVILLIVAYNSVYFKNLNEVRASAKDGNFDAAAYAENYWNAHLKPRLQDAISLKELYPLLRQEKEKTFKKYSHALGIGNIRYFLVRGEGTISEIKENEVTIAIPAGTGTIQATIATEFIYGNTIRDAIGGLNINDFDNTMHLNQLSEEINKKVRGKVIPSFRAQVKKGDHLMFTGAIELNEKFMNLENVEIVPIEFNLKNLNP